MVKELTGRARKKNSFRLHAHARIRNTTLFNAWRSLLRPTPSLLLPFFRRFCSLYAVHRSQKKPFGEAQTCTLGFSSMESNEVLFLLSNRLSAFDPFDETRIVASWQILHLTFFLSSHFIVWITLIPRG